MFHFNHRLRHSPLANIFVEQSQKLLIHCKIEKLLNLLRICRDFFQIKIYQTPPLKQHIFAYLLYLEL